MFKHGYLWSTVEAEALLFLKVAMKGEEEGTNLHRLMRRKSLNKMSWHSCETSYWQYIGNFEGLVYSRLLF